MEEFNLLDTKGFNSHLIATKDAGIGPDGLKTKTAIVQPLSSLPNRNQSCMANVPELGRNTKNGSSHFQNKRKFDE